jgi:curved DNA-binding protein CbpA
MLILFILVNFSFCVDLYKELELPKGSKLDEIKMQYDKLIEKYHPDNFPGDI